MDILYIELDYYSANYKFIYVPFHKTVKLFYTSIFQAFITCNLLIKVAVVEKWWLVKGVSH
jgi:hypothetical protein